MKRQHHEIWPPPVKFEMSETARRVVYGLGGLFLIYLAFVFVVSAPSALFQ